MTAQTTVRVTIASDDLSSGRRPFNVLNPDVVVLGGGPSLIDEIYGRGRDAVARRVFNDELRTPIRRHQLGDSAGVIGAALLG